MDNTDKKKKAVVRPEVTGLRQQPYAAYYKDLVADNTNEAMQGMFDQSVYDKLLRDDQVHAAMTQRIASVIGAEWRVERGGDDDKSRKAAEFLEENIKALNWNRICAQMMYATFYGYSVSECLYGTDGKRIYLRDIKIRERENFGWNADEKPIWLLDVESGKQGKAVDNPAFWWCRHGSVNNSELYGRGLANVVYYPVIFKHSGVNYWLDFLDKFANPTMVGKPSEYDNEENAQQIFLNTIEALHGSGGTVLKYGQELEILESLRTGGDYDTFTDWCNTAISKAILGQSMSIEDGTSKSFGKTMLEIRAERSVMDDDMVSGSFNRQIVPFLINSNFKGAKMPRVYRDLEVREDMEAQSRADIRVFNLGYEPTQDYIEKTYGKGWEKSDRPTALKPEDGAFQNRPDGNVSDANTSVTEKSVKDFADQMDAAGIDFVENLASGQRMVDEIADDSAKKLPVALDKMIVPVMEFMAKNGIDKTIEKLEQLVPQANMDELMDVMGSAQELAAAIGRAGK